MSDGQKGPATISERLENLVFRRQFLLGPGAFTPTPRWQTFPLDHGLVLSAHPDLEVVTRSTQKTSVTLLGFILDPFNPVRTSEDIVQILAERSSSLTDLLGSCEPLSGRWALLFQNQESSYIFTDPFGFRQVFYSSNKRRSWCGSQPEIIKAARGLEREEDDELLAFMLEPKFAEEESAWIGNRTPYKDCYHLLPNHYLKIETGETIRFFPSAPLKEKTLSEIVETATEILQGSFTAITRRSAVTLPVTAGWDSRVLLAASKIAADRIEYFIDRFGMLSKGHPDVWLPSHLAKKLGYDFVVKDSKEELPGWFVSLLAGNVTDARVLPKTRMIYAKFMAQETRINLNGNGGEVCRYPLEEYFHVDPNNTTIDDIKRCFGYPHRQFVRQELENWYEDFTASGVGNFNILDVLYWEQRIGNWGAQFPAEQDIAVEEFSPFNCRLLITTLFAAPRKLRAFPHCPIYRHLIEAMWPEVLAFPVNPGPKLDVDLKSMLLFLRSKLRPYVPQPIVVWLKSKGYR